MILPSKLLPFKKTILYKTIFILNKLVENDYAVTELYEIVSEHFEDINEFIITLDTLYVLNPISFIEELKVIKYVRKN